MSENDERCQARRPGLHQLRYVFRPDALRFRVDHRNLVPTIRGVAADQSDPKRRLNRGELRGKFLVDLFAPPRIDEQ